MKDIQVVTVNSLLAVDSRTLAASLDHRHRTILENLDKYRAEFDSINPIPFQTEKGKELEHGGFAKETRYAMLTEDHCYFLLTLMRNNSKVVAAKLALVKAFSNARAQLANRDIARLDGKEARRIETDSIKRLVEYAYAHGSKHASTYYANITKMTNTIMGIESGQRDDLSADQLKQIAVIESVVDIAIRDGMKAELHYKDIYRLAKDRAEGLVKALGLQS